MHLIKKALLSICAISAPAFADLVTVPSVDLTQYAGRWYQISANPMPFDKGCFCAQQTLTAQADGNLGVYNSCNTGSVTGPLDEIRGVATAVDKQTNTKFVVDFNLPWKGDYWIIGLAPDYSWAVVSEPSETALFILSKTPTLSPEAQAAALASAAAQVDTSKLVPQVHAGCTYPPL